MRAAFLPADALKGAMLQKAIKLKTAKSRTFLDKVREILPSGGNLNLCLTCGACASGCPATGLEDMDPRKFLRMAALGMDEEIAGHPWVWMCSMCSRCTYVCPMEINHCRAGFRSAQTLAPGTKTQGYSGFL